MKAGEALVGETVVNAAFDVRGDAGGCDPGSKSRTLRRYRQLLRSEQLSGGTEIALGDRLHRRSSTSGSTGQHTR